MVLVVLKKGEPFAQVGAGLGISAHHPPPASPTSLDRAPHARYLRRCVGAAPRQHGVGSGRVVAHSYDYHQA